MIIIARLIDADALITEAYAEGAYGYVDALQIANAPTIDAVPVLRCWECKYHEDTSVVDYKHCYLIDKTVHYNDYCSYGERKKC